MLLEMFSPDQDSDSVSYDTRTQHAHQQLRFSPIRDGDSQSHASSPRKRRKRSQAASVRRSASEPRSLPRSSPDPETHAKHTKSVREGLTKRQVNMDEEIARGMMAIDQLGAAVPSGTSSPVHATDAHATAHAHGAGMSMPPLPAAARGGSFALRDGGFGFRGGGFRFRGRRFGFRRGGFRGRGRRGGRRGRMDEAPPACWLRMSAALQPLYRVPPLYRNFPRCVVCLFAFLLFVKTTPFHYNEKLQPKSHEHGSMCQGNDRCGESCKQCGSKKKFIVLLR